LRSRAIRPASLFFRLAASHLKSRVEKISIEKAARTLFDGDSAMLITRATASPATTTGAGWADVIAAAMISDLLTSISSLSAAASLIGAGIQVSLDGIGSLKIPGRLVNPALAGTWVAEGSPAPVRTQSVFAGPTLTPRKLVALATFTNEQAASSNIEPFVRAALSEALALALDLKMFSADAATTAAPAGLLNGVAAIPATALGGQSPNVVAAADLGNIVKAIAANGGGQSVVFVASPAQANTLSMFGNGSTPVYASATVPDKTIIGIEAASFVSGFGSVPTFDVSTGSVVHEEDTSPSAVVASAPTRSLFQTDCLGLRAILRAAWAMRVTGHVAWVSGTNW
jgi:hypothetical protein